MPSRPDQPDPPPADRSLEEILDQYLEELAADDAPDQERYLREYPQLADALRGVFKTLDFVEAASKSVDATRLERGRQLGDYRIVREVGRGGMGVVYEAIQTSLDRRVALKVLPTAAMLGGNAVERFTREAATAGQLHHTNIVPVHAVGTEQGIHYYVMQYIEGRSLSEHMKKLRAAGTPPGRDYHRRVAHWGRQAAEALEYAHGQGIVHRDMKPSNLLLDARDNVWIADFGLARADAQATITVSGDVLGTARYMSPEQARGGRDQVDHRTDIYSLGATLYELLALEPAYDGESREAVLNQIAFDTPRPLRQINTSIPRDLETIVSRCMAKEPRHRYARAMDVAEDCRRFLAGESIRARRTPVVVRAMRFVSRHRLMSLATLVVLALTIATAVLVMNLRRVHGQRHVEEAYTSVLFERDLTHAAGLLDQAEDLGVNSAGLHLCRGLIPLLDNQPRQALTHLGTARERDPDHLETKLALALAYNSSADFVNGQRMLDTVSPHEITTALGWQLRGLALSKSQRRDAIEAYNQAIEVRPDFTPAIGARAHYRGVRLLTEGVGDELAPMLADLDALVVFRPNSARACCARAEGLLIAAAYATTQDDLRDSGDALLARCWEDIERARRLRRDDDSLPAVREGVYLHYVGDFAGTARSFAEAIAIDDAAGRAPHPYRVHERALALHALGEFQAALDEVEPAVRRDPTYCPLQIQQALLLAELDRLPEARDVARRCLASHPGNLNALFLSAVTLELLGDRDSAARAIGRAVEAGDADTAVEGGNVLRQPARDYLAGRIDADQLLAAAHGDPGHTCEFAFLIAMRRLARHDRPGGRAALQTCLDTHVFVFTEYRFAQTIMARMTADAEWPKWVVAP